MTSPDTIPQQRAKPRNLTISRLNASPVILVTDRVSRRCNATLKSVLMCASSDELEVIRKVIALMTENVTPVKSYVDKRK
jgi:hypothetical protein